MVIIIDLNANAVLVIPWDAVVTYNPKEHIKIHLWLISWDMFPYMGCIVSCGPKPYAWFYSRLVINDPWIGYGFFTLLLNWVYFLEDATFSSLSIRSRTKALHKLCFGQLLWNKCYILSVSWINGLVQWRSSSWKLQPQLSDRVLNSSTGHK